MMRRMEWRSVVGLVAVFALAACGGDAGAESEDMTEEPVAEAPAETPATGGQQVAMGTPPAGATQEQVTQGQQIFSGNGNCFTCHGMDATGTQLAPNLTDSEWINIEGEVNWDAIQQVVRTGVPNPKQHPSPMPAMGGAQLSDQEVQAVSAYVYAISH